MQSAHCSAEQADTLSLAAHKLELDAISLSVVGPNADADASSPESRGAQKFQIIEGEKLRQWMDRMEPRRSQVSTGDGNTSAAGGGGTVGDAVPMEE